MGVIDLTCVGNAAIAGFDYKYLQSTPLEYTLAISTYYLGYLIFEIPSTLVSKILGLQVWLPIMMICWAAVSMSQAWCTNAIQLGISELTLRYSIFMALVSMGGAFSGFVSYFIVQIQGSLKGFQWLIIIENLPAILLAIIVALFLTRGPENARFFTPDERELAVERLKSEGGPAKVDRNTAKAQIKLALTDIQTYIYQILFLIISIPFFSLSFYLPTLIFQLGFTDLQAQLMVIPPFLTSTVFMIINSRFADKYKTRSCNILIGNFVSIIGLVGLLATRANDPSLYNLRYFFTILLACGAYSVVPIIFSWCTCNIVGQYKRSIMIAMVLALANIAGIIGTLIFPISDAPSFIMGNSICLASMIIASIITIGLKFYLESINKNRDLAIIADHNYKLNDIDLKDNKRIREIAMKLVENEPIFDEVLCDRHPNWRYII
ncbi:242_t:CDS:2 [Scutellospora calospora]|uniref:242_t:CDS:1 n=1 Tax=Scutellospora calospora TaxID=85575 RepID=A0ACA9K6W5_9GLOM|nr:242_t:CDS:2 [Scutellospora calospora]